MEKPYAFIRSNSPITFFKIQYFQTSMVFAVKLSLIKSFTCVTFVLKITLASQTSKDFLVIRNSRLPLLKVATFYDFTLFYAQILSYFVSFWSTFYTILCFMAN